MNLGITITSAVLLLLVVAPVALIQQQQKKKEKNLLKALKTLTNQHHATLSEYDVFRNFAIGMDSETKRLFFYKKDNSNIIAQHFDLNEFTSCGILKSKKASPQNKSEQIAKLQLILNPKHHSKAHEAIEIYNQESDFQLDGELDVLHKWERLIQNSLK
ncbi:hypothetical protein [Psychroserpens sp. SPM9]|uniref:hypothetical protein n=1 Tax=Psychroserpens sp. SPM9 TaxID=2975598 RepID=UPI0021A891B9|nr:hypothetical protein [Psychroserpens sp. SPM9]MDG5491237.1 hypothetical protein [Psychroserpens sp. SPM9]